MSPREVIIKLFYRELLGREADEGGLKNYAESSNTLDSIYVTLYHSDEAKRYREEQEKEKALKGLPITLAMFVKDNEDSIAMAIESALPIVSEVVIVDTGSSDNTVEICKGLGARVYNIDFNGFSGFGDLRTVTAHLSTEEWVLGLDSDEVILEEDYPLFFDLLENDNVDAWGLPRKRWLDLEMTTQLEKDVYPDYQYRLIRNKPSIYYKRRVHEVVAGTKKTNEAKDGPHIHHLQDVFKHGDRLVERNKQYKKLQSEDIAEGVKHTEKAVQDLDER